ncbi:hypothetical protein Tsubulata_012502 [Turnera subulata]|uniref:Thioredoxin domain-containing protein n=1 Tax=Turnera subulata TaxID=218843 RepID=A0A9Q0J1V7_9ROSI|nr:hypothetical protein Tsubulata_012502 [Turnera subulata]
MEHAEPTYCSPLPDFEAEAVFDQEFIKVKLSEYIGKKYVIPFFYPLDFTFVCPTKIAAFSDRYAEFEKKNTEVLGVSVDSVDIASELKSDATLELLKLYLTTDEGQQLKKKINHVYQINIVPKANHHHRARTTTTQSHPASRQGPNHQQNTTKKRVNPKPQQKNPGLNPVLELERKRKGSDDLPVNGSGGDDFTPLSTPRPDRGLPRLFLPRCNADGDFLATRAW